MDTIEQQKVEKEIIQCHICHTTFTSKRSLKTHMDKHNGLRYICSYQECYAILGTRHALKGHIKRRHEGIRAVSCFVPLCEKTFPFFADLENHMKTHDKPFLCHICKKGFQQCSNVLKHLNTHRDQKGHICQVCKKEFSKSNTLTQHLSIHKSERDVSCPHCKKPFKNMRNLQKHLGHE